MQTDAFAYGPLVAFLRSRFHGSTSLFEAPLVYVDEKRTLLEAAHRQHGESALLDAGRAAAQLDGHPFLAAVLATRSPTALLSCWCSLEVLGHASNRIVVDDVADTNVRLRRVTTSGGTPSIAEDLFILGLLSGLLERLGTTLVNAVPEIVMPGATGRHWTLRWTAFSRRAILPSRSNWLVGSDFAWGVLGFMLQGIDDGNGPPRISEVAARFGLPGRTLQRRLNAAQTSSATFCGLRG